MDNQVSKDRKRVKKLEEIMKSEMFMDDIAEFKMKRLFQLDRLTKNSDNEEIKVFSKWVIEKKNEEIEEYLNSEFMKVIENAESIEEIYESDVAMESVEQGTEKQEKEYLEFLRELHAKVNELGGRVKSEYLRYVERCVKEYPEEVEQNRKMFEEAVKNVKKGKKRKDIKNIVKQVDRFIEQEEKEEMRTQKEKEEEEKRQKEIDRRYEERKKEELDLLRWKKGSPEEVKAYIEDHAEVMSEVNENSNWELLEINQDRVLVKMNGRDKLVLVEELLTEAENEGLKNVSVRLWHEGGLVFTDNEGLHVPIKSLHEGYLEEDAMYLFFDKAQCSEKLNKRLGKKYKEVKYGIDKKKVANDIWSQIKK